MQLIEPMGGCRVVIAEGQSILFGQPPEVIKSLARNNVTRLDVLVLPDSRERGGVLLNNLEFPLYHFLFISNGLMDGRKLHLVGMREQVEQVLDLLRLTLLGPNLEELEGWGTAAELRAEWLNAGEFFALKDATGRVLQVTEFFDIHCFDDGPVALGAVTIEHTGFDQYAVVHDEARQAIDLTGDHTIVPPYALNPDQVPGNLVGFGLEILGGASGFSPEQASTGMVLCHHGNYILIDCIPFLEHHLEARGISMNQIRTLILTHLHDDHCSMFPLLLSAERVEIISTREIFEMAMVKLARGLGWEPQAVARSFKLIEVHPGEPFHHYGLEIEPHVTVHSIPTIGVTVRSNHLGRSFRICVVGDNQSFDEISAMRRAGRLRESTEANLHALYREPYDLLIADGGMGAIHGDPADAINSQAERVVFVHVDRLPQQFSATFSLASAGKRYTVIDGEPDLYTARALDFFTSNFDEQVPSRWLTALLGDKRIVRYNRDDVILKQGSATRGDVFVVLTGRCEVLVHDGTGSTTVGTREAGDLIGEMAAVTGLEFRNASVIARTPVTLCEFSEETFLSFVSELNLVEGLRERWVLRERLSHVPALSSLSTSVIERIARVAQCIGVAPGEQLDADPGYWYLIIDGEASVRPGGATLSRGAEGGDVPLSGTGWRSVHSVSGCELARIDTQTVEMLRTVSPQFNYRLQKFRAQSADA